MNQNDPLDALHSIVEPTIVTVGTFDGVHLGHQHLLAELKGLAAQRGLKTCVVTFDRSPRSVLRPDAAVERLSTLSEKIDLLYEQGIDYVVPLRFTSELASVCARDFAVALHDRLGMETMLMGHSNRLGHLGEGTPATMARLGEELGFDVVVAKSYELNQPVNSTAIRAALNTGDVANAHRLLGRPYVLQGCMVRNSGERLELLVPSDRAMPRDCAFSADVIAERTRFAVRAEYQPAAVGAPFQTLGVLDTTLEPNSLLLGVSVQLLT